MDAIKSMDACKNSEASNSIWQRLANNRTSISRVVNSTIWTPTTHKFLWKFAKKSSKRRKIHEERRKKEKILHFLSDRYQTIGSPMQLVRQLKSNRYFSLIFRQLLLSLIAIGISEFYRNCTPLIISIAGHQRNNP